MKKNIVKGIAVALGLVVVAWVLLPGGHNHAHDHNHESTEANGESGITWYCSMTQCGVSGLPNPGKCPKCGMDLVPTDASAPQTGPREVAFAVDAAKLVRVQTAVASRQPVSAVVTLSGKVAEDETRRSVISARFDGRIERLYMDHEGLRVRKGDHMADIYAPDLSLSLSTLLSARNGQSGYGSFGVDDIEDTRVRLRNRGLTDEQIDELIETGTMRSVFTITSPMGGVVVERMATRGQYVNEGTPLFAIADLSRVWVELAAHESDLSLLRFRQRADLTIAAMPGERFEGVVAFIDPVMDEASRTVRVRLDVANPQHRLKPGMLVKAEIAVPLTDDGQPAGHNWQDGEHICPMHPLESASAPGECPVCDMTMVPAESMDVVDAVPAGRPLVVPESAILATGRRSLVYVVKPGDDGAIRYEAREVTTGNGAGAMRVVLSGLAEGEAVVAVGAFQVDSAMQIQGKFSLMQTGDVERDPFFGSGSHDGDPQPGWYAAADPSSWNPQSVYPAFDLQPLLGIYFDVAAALAADDAGAARAGAERLSSWSAGLGKGTGSAADTDFPAVMQSLLEQSSRMAGAAGLAEQRAAFRDVSGTVTLLARRYGAGAVPVRSMFCPMAFDDAGAFWLQREAQVANPYHGLEMLRCGWEVETIPHHDL
ncbi:MAG: efflux RND transporter periplasmic adaptor subunit [Planctomycetaceae bacterium]|nr:efflux RND transporter periplasmic adaptor subunit [Planctomycetaceae bacterium]